MDPIGAADSICSLISNVMKMITLFKNRDHYLENIKEFLNSMAESIKKYEASPFKVKKQLSYEGLNKELKNFYLYLDGQKKKKRYDSFFCRR